jgi:hypothetical protein
MPHKRYSLRSVALALGLCLVALLVEALSAASVATAQAQGQATPEPWTSPDLARLRSFWAAHPEQALSAALRAQYGDGASADRLRAVETEPRLLWVDANAPAGGDGSDDAPFNAIQPAIDAANPGDVVLVRAGLYTGAPVTMKVGVDVVGATPWDPAQVRIQSTAAQVLVCADDSLLQDVTLEAQQNGDVPLIGCTGGAPLFNRIIANQVERIAIGLENTTGALIFNSELSALSLTGAAWLSGNLVFGTTDLHTGTPPPTRPYIVDANILVGPLQLQALDALPVPHRVSNNWLLGVVVQGYLLENLVILNQHNASILVAHNTILGGAAGIRFEGSDAVRIVNNIIGYTDFALRHDGGTRPIIESNVFWSNFSNGEGIEDPVGSNGNLETDPRFVNLGLGDFRLAADSPLINTGATVAEVVNDFDFEPRPCDGGQAGNLGYDIGADEVSGLCTSPTLTATTPATATAIITATPAVTGSVTPTTSPTVSATATITASPTLTPTITTIPTASPTVSATATITASPTMTETVTPTATVILTASPTVSATATITASPTLTAAVTPTATATLTDSPTVSATATIMASPMITATQTPTETMTPTSTVMLTDSPTLTATQTVTATPTTTATASSPSPTSTESPPTTSATVGPGCTQLLLDPGFEERSGWTLPATNSPASYSSEQIFAGASSLRVGIPADARHRTSYSTGYQWIRLPAQATSITLDAEVWRSSPGPSSDKDLQYLWVTVAGGLTYRVWEGRADTQTWEPITYDLTPFKGQSVRVLLGVYNNGSGERTLLYADEVTVTACEELTGK